MTLKIEVPSWRYASAVEVARQFRKAPTRSEAILWEALRGKRLAGLKFRRQHPIGPFVVDFYCRERSLVVEVDGAVHEETRQQDARRQSFLEEHGLTVVRVSAAEVETDLQRAIWAILAALSPELTS